MSRLSEAKDIIENNIVHQSQVTGVPVKKIKRSLINDWNMYAYDVRRQSEGKIKPQTNDYQRGESDG